MGTIKILGFDEDGNAQRLKIRIARFLDYDPVTASDKSNIRSTLGITSQGGLGDLLAANNLDDVASLDTTKANLEIPDVGTAPDETPLNQHLGSLAYADADSVAVAELQVESTTGTGSTQALTVTDGSNTKLVVQEDGKVGIGGTPNYALDVSAGSVSLDSDWPLYFGSTNAFIEGGTSGTKLRLNHSAGLNVTNAGTTHLAIDSSGNTGFGSAPAINLGGGLSVDGGSGYVNLNLVKGSSGTGHAVDFSDENGALQFRVGTNFSSGGNNLIFARGTGSTIAWKIDSATGNLVANSTGIDFGSTNTNSGVTVTESVMSDYEVGTWTPFYTTTSSGFTTPPTMDVLNARYVRIGSLVTFFCHIQTDSVDLTGAGTYLLLDGLPYAATVSSGYNSVAVNVGYATGWSNAPAGGYINSGQRYIYLTKRHTSITGDLKEMSPSDLTAGTVANKNSLAISGSYYTNA